MGESERLVNCIPLILY